MNGEMVLWIVFTLMTAAAIAAVVWPLARKPRTGAAGSEVVVYKDQLEEIERDRGAGLIGPAEAEAARLEVSRRLLAAADKAAAAPVAALLPRWHRRAAALGALVVLSLVPVGLYVVLGSPNIPADPECSASRARHKARPEPATAPPGRRVQRHDGASAAAAPRPAPRPLCPPRPGAGVTLQAAPAS